MGLFSIGGVSPSFQDFVLTSEKLLPAAGGRSGEAMVLRKNGILDKKRSFEPDEKAENIRVWRAFRKAIEAEFSSRQVKAYSARYGIDWKGVYSGEVPLERRHIEYYGVAAASPYIYFLKEQSWFSFFSNLLPNFSSLSNLLPEEVHDLVQKVTRNGHLGTVQDPTEISGGVRRAHEQLGPSCFLTDQARANLFRGIPSLVSQDSHIPRLHPYYSRLEMAIICLLETNPERPTLGAVIPAPGNVDGTLEYYYVHQIISKGGINVIALRPISDRSTLRPLLCFRCTKQTIGHHGALDSNFENINEHIGKSGYEAGKKEIDELLNNREFTLGRKINVLCYSQGGAHAAYCMADHPDKIDEFVAFNSVGSDAKVVESFASKVNSMGEHTIPPAIYQHRNVSNVEGTEGDWVNYVGQKHLGWGLKHRNARVAVYEWHIDDHPGPTHNIFDPKQIRLWLEFHGIRPMDQKKEGQRESRWSTEKWFYAYRLYQGAAQVDPILNTYKRNPTLENLRHDVGFGVFYTALSFQSQLVQFFWRQFEIWKKS